MITIGICDDNVTLLQKYSTMIEDICEKRKQKVNVHMFSDGTEVINKFHKGGENIDILFLDILMGELNGVETARRLRELKSKAIIIFLTSSEEFIFDSMDIHALAYLMKDQMTKDAMEVVLQNSLNKVEKQRNEMLHFDKDGDAYCLSYGDICFIKVHKGFCYIHHWDGIIFESANLSILEALGKSFFRVHEQYIVNLQYVGRIESDYMILSDKSKNEIPIDKANIKQFKLQFAAFMMDKI